MYQAGLKKYSSDIAAENITSLLRINTTIVGNNLDGTYANIVYMLACWAFFS